MKIRSIIIVALLIGIGWLSTSCGDDADFKSGMVWLEKDNNGVQAVRAFRRSLDKSPKKWKTHRYMLEALSRGDDVLAMEQQLKETLRLFPDSARSHDVVIPGTALLGEEQFNKIASSITQTHISNLLRDKGDKVDLLSRGIMAGCRMKDTVIVEDYFKRLLATLKGVEVPDTVMQEMGFFFGQARISSMLYDWRIEKNPADLEARLKQLDAGIIMGDKAFTVSKLKLMAQNIPTAVSDEEIARRFSGAVEVDQFKQTALVNGWDASFSPDGQSMLLVQDKGTRDAPDHYIMKATAGGAVQGPLMKAVQNFMVTVAWPTYSPDGKWIYFYGSPDKGWEPGKGGRFYLYRMPPFWNAPPERLSETDLLPAPLHFAKDGSVLCVRRDVGSTKASAEIMRLAPGAKKLASVSRIPEPVIGATFTPAGDSIVFSTDRGIFRRSINGGLITVDLAWKGMLFPHITPDGSKLLMTTKNNILISVDRSTAVPTWIGEFDSPVLSFQSKGKMLTTKRIGGVKKVITIDLNNKVSTENFSKAISK